MKMTTHTIDAVKFQEALDSMCADKDKRIAALEGTVTRLRARLIAEKELLYDQIKIDMKTSRENEQLKASNHVLREALQNIVNTFYEETDVAWMRQCYDLMELGKQALSATPAESLQAHDDEDNIKS